MFFLNVGARASVMFFQKILMFCFSRSLYAIKRRWARFRLPFVVVNINKMIFVIKAPQREALASDNLALPSIFFNYCGEISQNFHSLWNLSCRSFKSWKKIGVTKEVSSLFAILCFLPPSQIWSYEFFLTTGTRKGANMFNGLANLWKFQRWKRDQSCSKDPYFLCCKTLRNGLRLRQDLYLSMRKLSKLSPISNLSHGVFFSVDLFFRRRRPMNITGAVAGNPRFHYRKTALS